MRLKYNIKPLDEIPEELFYELKPHQFNYKTDTKGKGVHFWIISAAREMYSEDMDSIPINIIY